MSSSLICSTKKSLLEQIALNKGESSEKVSINVDLLRKSASEKFDADFFVLWEVWDFGWLTSLFCSVLTVILAKYSSKISLALPYAP